MSKAPPLFPSGVTWPEDLFLRIVEKIKRDTAWDSQVTVSPNKLGTVKSISYSIYSAWGEKKKKKEHLSHTSEAETGSL